MITRARYYSCPYGCMNRGRDHIDEFVEKVIAKRLSMKDATKRKRVNASPTAELEAAIQRQDERIARAEHDYDL